MKEEFAAYLDQLFAELPHGKQVSEAKEELLAGMVERYQDYRAAGMDEPGARAAVLDSIGDVQELFDALRMAEEAFGDAPPPQEQPEQPRGEKDLPPYGGESAQHAGAQGDWWHSANDFGLSELIGGVTGLARELLSGIIPSAYGQDMRLVNRVSIPADGLHTVEANMAIETVDIFAAQDDAVTVLEYRNQEPPQISEVTQVGGLLRIHAPVVRTGLGQRARLELYIPASWRGALTVHTASGSVKSGAQWHLKSLACKTMSGSIELRAAQAEHISLRAVSGAVLAEQLTGALRLNSVSGSVKGDCASGHGELRSTSGSVRARFVRLDGDLTAESVSGSVRVELPRDASFTLQAKTTSGSVHSSFGHLLQQLKRNHVVGQIGNPPYHSVNLKTVSGSIRLNDEARG